MRTRNLIGSIVTALLLSPGLSLAEPTQPGASAETAEALFNKGKAAFKAGHFEDAYSAYSAAWAKHKTYDIAGNLAQVEVKLGKVRDAAEHFRFVVENLPPSLSAEQRGRIEKSFEATKAQLGAVRVTVSAPGAAIAIDGRNAGVSPLEDEVFVDPGEHAIEARAAGFKVASVRLTVAKGQHATTGLVLEREETPAPQEGSSARTASLVGGSSLAVVGIGAGVVFAVLSGGKSSARTEAIAALGVPSPCGEGTQAKEACAAIESDRKAQNTFRGLAIGSFAVGGAALVATVVYGLVTSSKKAPAKAAVVPSTDGRSHFLTWVGRF